VGKHRHFNVLLRLAANPPCCHCQGTAAHSIVAILLPNMLERILPLVLPDAWLPAAFSSGNDLLFGVLTSIDRLCAQFATALEHAEHQHFFLLAALIGTLTLVFPTHH
jgi:hypothetical protein